MSYLVSGNGKRAVSSAANAFRPVIGISCYSEQARWGHWDIPAMVLPRHYADRVAEAGGIPILLPPVSGVHEGLGRLDGLMLSGGGDIDPSRYEAERAAATEVSSRERDEAEVALFSEAMSLGLPVLGICRGLQLINVARGGTLHQHLPDVVGHDEHSAAPGSYGAHEVRVAPGSRLAGILGRTELADHLPVVVPTHHHQGVGQLGKGLSPVAWAADGMVEAIELDQSEHAFVVAVQWHPEAGEDQSLFRALVAAAAGRPAGTALAP
ncbi:MAG TPA: gamma-glutamyl-gamma-aminobutyrate hydrolase family protein [Streptosporangiaceae bacterium]|nr:gamma-glutamyl-gamma-aminobutyrate hydrolase family protein [Streptosporangiaceae bacterium]